RQPRLGARTGESRTGARGPAAALGGPSQRQRDTPRLLVLRAREGDAVTTRLDAITLEVLWTRLISVVDEAAKAIVRTSFSTLSNEANDFACMLTDARGYSLAQNSGSIPSFIGTLPATVRHFLRAMGASAMRPGDVLITNDAWMGTGHMSDVCVLKPIFRAGRLVAFSATTSHMPDIGGRLRAIEAREVFEEGLHIPLMKLIREGRADDTLIEMIRANVRTPDQTVGDIWAQVGANEGMYLPIRVTEPEGCLLNPRFPAAVVSRAVTGHYVPVLLFGALHQVVPDRVMAGAGSPLWAVQQTGLRADGRPYTNIFFFNGGMGATPTKDGESVLSW